MSKIDVRAYPLDESTGSTRAFASVAIDDLVVIRSVRVVDSEKGLFVAMPQSQDNSGRYHDISFPLTAELRKEITNAVIDEYAAQAGMDADKRGYSVVEMQAALPKPEDVKLDIKVFPIKTPRGETLAFASVALNDKVAIRGIRVANDGKGPYVAMPQSKDSEGKYHDVAFPIGGQLRKAISISVLDKYKEAVAERKQSLDGRLAEGKDKAAKRAPVPRNTAAKGGPGLGD